MQKMHDCMDAGGRATQEAKAEEQFSARVINDLYLPKIDRVQRLPNPPKNSKPRLPVLFLMDKPLY